MKVKSIMTPEVATCPADAPIHAAARIMWERDCGAVPVTGESGEVVGVVSDRDICMATLLSGRPQAALQVKDAMARPALTCHADDNLREVHALMREHQVRRLPVLDRDEQLVGIVALNDLAVEAFDANTSAAKNRRRDVAKTLAAISEPRPQPEPETSA